jgi:hypothetical protein
MPTKQPREDRGQPSRDEGLNQGRPRKDGRDICANQEKMELVISAIYPAHTELGVDGGWTQQVGGRERQQQTKI